MNLDPSLIFVVISLTFAIFGYFILKIWNEDKNPEIIFGILLATAAEILAFVVFAAITLKNQVNIFIILSPIIFNGLVYVIRRLQDRTTKEA